MAVFRRVLCFGFTLTEIMMVIIIVGVMAAAGLPNFNKALIRARARDAINNLTIIQSAQMIYSSQYGNFRNAANTAAVNAINGANSLNIIENGSTYACNNATPPTTCVASGGNFTVTVTLGSAINPGTNPACVSNPVANKNCP